MSIFLILFIYSAHNNIVLGQENLSCAYDPVYHEENTTSLPAHNSGSIDPLVLAGFDVKVFNVYYWQINDTQGNFGINATPGEQALIQSKHDALKSIARLNQEYNDYKIFFKFRGIGEIDTPNGITPPSNCSQDALDNFSLYGYTVLNRCQYAQFHNYVSFSASYDEDAINIFLAAETTGFGGVSYFRDIMTNRNNAANGVIIHEMGHSLGLDHTFYKYQNALANTSVFNECEHVTRDPSELNFNAIYESNQQRGNGDIILDTNAVPNFHQEYCWNNNLPFDSQDCKDAIEEQYPQGFGDYNILYTHTQDIEDCVYIGTGRDCEENFYDIFSEDVQNWMAYTPGPCRNQFTIGQAIHIHEDAEQYSTLENRLTTIESLYEPYEGAYFFIGPYDPILHKTLFQPGFNYKFITCEGDYPQPAQFNESFTFYTNQVIKTVSASETHFSTIFHPNHTAIIIEEIDIANQYAAVKKCYNNYNRSPKGGKITKFNDGVFNYNITETPKDSIGINSANLIPALDPGLYKIEKEYHDGTTLQTIIQKENE